MLYKERRSFESRITESSNILSKYKDRIPIVCERHSSCHTLPEIDKQKYLVPRDLTIGQFMYVLRKRLHITAEQAIFLFTESGQLPPAGSSLNDIYNSAKDEDGFLYIRYSGENTFGFV